MGLRQRLTDRWLGRPERAAPERLAELAVRATPGVRARAIRRLALAGVAPRAIWFSDPVPGVRRAAAWGASWTGAVPGGELLAHAEIERIDLVRLELAVAAHRAGAPGAWDIVSKAARREFATLLGTAQVGEAVGRGSRWAALCWVQRLDPAADPTRPEHVVPVPIPTLRERAQAALEGPRSRDAIVDLAALGHPDDLDLWWARRIVSGRREAHVLVEALGLQGDGRAVGALRDTLQAADDPGHGFRARAQAAEALGHLGLPDGWRLLARALEVEALEFEGRPGAGLGIQKPVRATILWAMGECASTDRALIASHLANTHGSALGGFYLPAMDALWKLGDVAFLATLSSAPEEVAANAAGVLGALGADPALEVFVRDPRTVVRAAALRARELGPVMGSRRG